MKSTSVADTSQGFFFQLKYEDVWGVMTLTVNGFPVHQSGGGHITNNPVLAIGLNKVLVRGNNRVAVRAEPMIRASGSGIRIGPVELHGRVTTDYDGQHRVQDAEITTTVVDSIYRSWSRRAREQWKDYRSTTKTPREALDSIRAWTERTPMTVSTTFDNEAGPDFSRIFEEAPVIEGTPADTARLKDYAMRLRVLMAERDTAALMREFGPEVRYSYRRGANPGESLGEFRNAYREHLILNEAEQALAFSREEVRLKRWVDGRVWQLSREGTEGLLRRIEVYVAEVDGKLRVVR